MVEDPNIAKYRKRVGRRVYVCTADLWLFSHQGIFQHLYVGASIYDCDLTVKKSHMNRRRDPTLSFRMCLNSMATDGPSASNYIHGVKPASHDDHSR